MTPLRRRMTEDMQVRNLSSQTQATYVQQVSLFAGAVSSLGRQAPRLRYGFVAGLAAESVPTCPPLASAK